MDSSAVHTASPLARDVAHVLRHPAVVLAPDYDAIPWHALVDAFPDAYAEAAPRLVDLFCRTTRPRHPVFACLARCADRLPAPHLARAAARAMDMPDTHRDLVVAWARTLPSPGTVNLDAPVHPWTPDQEDVLCMLYHDMCLVPSFGDPMHAWTLLSPWTRQRLALATQPEGTLVWDPQRPDHCAEPFLDAWDLHLRHTPADGDRRVPVTHKLLLEAQTDTDANANANANAGPQPVPFPEAPPEALPTHDPAMAAIHQARRHRPADADELSLQHLLEETFQTAPPLP